MKLITIGVYDSQKYAEIRDKIRDKIRAVLSKEPKGSIIMEADWCQK